MSLFVSFLSEYKNNTNWKSLQVQIYSVGLYCK